MANISEADVIFRAYGCYKELKAYIEATNKFAYGLGNNGVLDREYGQPDNTGSMTCYGEGKWDYMRNLEIWFDEMNVNASTPINEVVTKNMAEAITQFNALKLAIKESNGYIEFDYNDLETGCLYLANVKGKIVLDKDNNLVLDEVNDQVVECSPQNIVYYDFADSLEDVKERYGLE